MSLIVARNQANNSAPQIYVVPAGKQLQLVSVWLQICNESGGTDYGDIYYRDAVPAIVERFLWFDVVDGGMQVATMNFYPNLIIPQNYDIRVHSNVAGLIADAGITGFEIVSG